MLGNLPLPDISLVIIIKLEIGRNIVYVHEVISMLEFLIYKIFVEFEGHIFQQIVGISMGPNCVFSLPIMFYFYEAELIANPMKDTRITIAFRYIDD